MFLVALQVPCIMSFEGQLQWYKYYIHVIILRDMKKCGSQSLQGTTRKLSVTVHLSHNVCPSVFISSKGGGGGGRSKCCTLVGMI